jgi:hypothetical protein
MKRLLIGLVALLLTADGAWAAVADDKPNFSGTWTYDASKSQAPKGQAGRARQGGGGGGGGARGGRGAALGLTPPEGPVTVTQTADQITIGAQTFKFDGSPTTLGGGGGKRAGSGTAKAHWDGAKLVIETTISARGNSITSNEVRSLAADGKEMIVERTISTPRGEMKARQVFTRTE